MRERCSAWVLALAGLCSGGALAAVSPPQVREVVADAPSELSVTVYRDPYRDVGAINLDYLGGFALIRETRELRLPAGVSRVRFEGVADGIEPVSAIITGLAQAVIEKNLDARLLSPANLIAAAAGKPVTLVRSDPKTGKTERLAGVILSGAATDGVVFQTRDGIEALHCSGIPETFSFDGTTGLTASPTLSVMIRTARPTIQRIQLSYLAHDFDWAANYTAILSADGRTIDLGAWVTLANGNGVGFPAARTQVVAGRLNRENGDVEPIDAGGPVLAQCWPQGRTSDAERVLQLSRAIPLGFEISRANGMQFASPAALLEEVAVTGSRVRQEQLGDLKLYRVPQRTTVASRQSKQVRLLDRTSIPVHKVYITQLDESEIDPMWTPASVVLRTRNDAEDHLGLPLPSGRLALFESRGGASLLLNEADVRDLALNEEVEIAAGSSRDVQIRYLTEQTAMDSAGARTIPLVPRVSIRQTAVGEARRVEVTNAKDSAIDFEIQLQLEAGARLVRADHALGTKNGRTIIPLKVPAHGMAVVRFQTQYTTARAVRE